MQKNNSEKILSIRAQLPIALQELAAYLLSKKEDPTEILDVLNTNPALANLVTARVVRRILRKKKLSIKLKNLEHDYNDSNNMTHGVAYFKVDLKGTENALKKIAGDTRLFFFDWQGYAEQGKELQTKHEIHASQKH